MVILAAILVCTIISVFATWKLIERHNNDIKATLLANLEREERGKTGRLKVLEELSRRLAEE